ncbi:MAG: ATP-grasp domain-containing protein, partial [Pseudomonadales bacterium]|nr:ATP-grasp domain-containing protein [Pseudomonadales bacterium]
MFDKLLIANRGEIAIRIMQTAANLGIRTAAVFSADDEHALHAYRADEAWPLPGEGASAYLDQDRIIEIAREHDCDAIHPGYGFLSENASFAENCARHGIRFIGPSPATLKLFGDKAAARRLSEEQGVPLVNGTDEAISLAEAGKFLASLDGRPMIIKAVAGGGGRGVRIVHSEDELSAAFERSASEARAAFGDDSLYVEEFMAHARHIEVQVLGDDNGTVIHLGERDCSIQRRHQKVIEIAPAPGLPEGLRDRIAAAAVKLAKAAGYQGAGTFEFLVDVDNDRFAFIEANARLQVEHTITEEVSDVDIVEAQIRIAGGESLEKIGLDPAPLARGFAIQLRINMETMQQDGTARPSGGVLKSFNPPSGPGIRLDTFAYAGYATSPRFDSLLAKLIVHHRKDDFEQAISAAYRALCEFQISGVDTNIPFLQNLLSHEDVRAVRFHTRFADDNMESLTQDNEHHRHYAQVEQIAKARQAGAKLDSDDPLGVLDYGRQTSRASATADESLDDSWVLSPMQGTIIEISVKPGDEIIAGQTLLIMDSMKMEHEIKAEFSGVVDRINVEPRETIYEKQPLLAIDAKDVSIDATQLEEEVDLDEIRPDLKEVADRRELTLDENRPDAVKRRHDKAQRTARENVNDLCDPDTFVEYGQLVLAAQRRRRSIDELIEKSPADGMITGVGSINGDLFDEPDNRCVVMSYDYTVFAGTQGGQNHRKTDRMIGVAEKGRMPLVLFAEGGGGRPGDTDGIGGETTTTFARFAQLSGLVPMVGITSGRCFAGNASLLGCCDVIIATENSNIGMGGPAMIEGGGLGIFTPEEI